MTINDAIHQAADIVLGKTDCRPAIGLVLGSGLGDYAKRLDNVSVFPLGEFAGFPAPTVHPGRLCIGTVNGVAVAVMQGRLHYYEGFPMEQTVMPIRLLAALGVSKLILTNASGGIADELDAGELMLLTDHLSLFVPNPLRGPNDDSWGPRFPDMTEVYDSRLRALALQAAAENGLRLHQGIYVQLGGPSFETPAEIRLLQRLGVDAVGMSTATEAIVARHAGLRVCGLSLITNRAAGLSDQAITVEEVRETAAQAASRFAALMDSLLEKLAQETP